MTCIVGLISKADNCIYIGGDSAGVSDFEIRIRKDPKVFIKDGFAFGFTTSFRMGQLLMCTPLKLRKQKKKESNYQYIVNSLIPKIREIFKIGGFMKIENNEESGGTFIIAYNGNLFEIHDDFQVAEYNEEYTACGCGVYYALGSLFSSGHLNDESRVKLALETAEKFNAGVRGPFNIIKLKF